MLYPLSWSEEGIRQRLLEIIRDFQCGAAVSGRKKAQQLANDLTEFARHKIHDRSKTGTRSPRSPVYPADQFGRKRVYALIQDLGNLCSNHDANLGRISSEEALKHWEQRQRSEDEPQQQQQQPEGEPAKNPEQEDPRRAPPQRSKDLG